MSATVLSGNNRPNGTDRPCLTSYFNLSAKPPVKISRSPARMEAFYTSGGAAALPELLKRKVKNLDCKTIHYPEHAEKIRACIELGPASQKVIALGKVKVTPRAVWLKLLSNAFPKTGRHVVLVSRYRSSG
ncbi:MAG: hypothetical protein ACRECJ_08960 [Limisphaerales bacterium]